MAKIKNRVITVSKDRGQNLKSFGKNAMELFPQTPTTAYNYVIRQLENPEDPIQYIDQDLDTDELPTYMAHWYFGQDLNNDVIK